MPLLTVLAVACSAAFVPAVGTVGAVSAADLRPRVLVISLDGLNPTAITRLGPAGTPNLHRLIAEGSSTLNARSSVELTLTLPNHTGMITGRRVEARRGGHGVTWNDDRTKPATVQAAAGHPVASIFSLVHAAGMETAMFAAKTKFSLFQRSWPDSFDTFVVRENNGALVWAARQELRRDDREFTFLHISLPDLVGHQSGFMSPEYLAAVKRTDLLVGKVLTTVDNTPALRDNLTVIVTADHGGLGQSHADATALANYRIPFIAWGHGVAPGTDLYAINPTFVAPGAGRPGYLGPQPIRNVMVANLAADLLGLGPVPGSELNAAQDLEVSPG